MLFWDSKATGNPVLILNFLHWQYHVSLMTFDRCKPGSTKVPFLYIYLAFPGSSHGKESDCNAGDPGLITGLEGSPGKGNGNLLQYSCLENSMDRGAWWATVHGVTKSRTRLSG